MKSDDERLVDKMVDIRNLFDDSDREAEGHGMDDLACCPISVACYAESKIKRLMAENEDLKKEQMRLYGRLNQIRYLTERKV